jgi:hypothetical protein
VRKAALLDVNRKALASRTPVHGRTGAGRRREPTGWIKDHTDGALFIILGVGSETMPGQGTRVRDKGKWDLVNCLRAVGGKVPEKSTGKEPETNIILVPQKPN